MKQARHPLLLFLTLAVSLSPLVGAHTIFTTLFINDESQGDGTCVRMNTDPQHCTSPIPSLTSDDMACGMSGQTPVAFTCPAPAGAKLTFQFREWADAEQPGVIDISHKGPCAVYAKQITDMSQDSAAGPGWFKLWDSGYDESAGQWCTEKLIADGGLLSIEIPRSLPAGSSWLFRPELLALQSRGDPQFYVGCAQVYIASESESDSESATDGDFVVPADKSVSIPGYVEADDPGLTFNIYSPSFPYPVPGPAVYVPSSSPPSVSSSSSTSSSKSVLGLLPPSSSYLIKNANWVGTELAPYTTEDGCWAAAEACWTQAGACYDAAPPTGSANCRVWERRCEDIQDACGAGSFVGPPDRGQKLQSQEPEPPAAGDIPDAVNAAATTTTTIARSRP
ncbi:glycoside hydrolase family 61 protein [Biscogniauxia marginata]|nr:glycoside hydrolase family 61 protein [Biscogniauxia marginata]